MKFDKNNAWSQGARVMMYGYINELTRLTKEEFCKRYRDNYDWMVKHLGNKAVINTFTPDELENSDKMWSSVIMTISSYIDDICLDAYK